jgi:hypothetical protein
VFGPVGLDQDDRSLGTALSVVGELRTDDDRRPAACNGTRRRAGRARLVGAEPEQQAETERIREHPDGGARLGHLDGGERADRQPRCVDHLIGDR